MCHACCGRKYPECCFSSFTIFFNRFIIRPTFIFDRDKMDSADQFDRTKMTTEMTTLLKKPLKFDNLKTVQNNSNLLLSVSFLHHSSRNVWNLITWNCSEWLKFITKYILPSPWLKKLLKFDLLKHSRITHFYHHVYHSFTMVEGFEIW